MRHLLACTCLTPVALALVATAAPAETMIATKRTTPAATSTINAGAADDIRITSAGSVELTAGTGITIDSNHGVKNEGKIIVADANDGIGILAQPGRAGSISNSGTITLEENYTQPDTDNDGDKDGPFATGARRFGIRVAPGGLFTGAVTNSGTISIEGNDSAGIAIDSALAGALVNTGKITVLGDRSTGLRAGDVTGAVRVAGEVSAQGKDAIGASFTGNISGALVIQGALAATGYRSATAPADVSKLDADDLLQGGPALSIAGDVAGGVALEIPPADASTTDTDEDDDGLADATEGSAAVSSFGAAPAIRIGAAGRAVAIGALAGQANGHGLLIKGNVLGSGVYAGVDGNAIVIGGLGQPVTIAGGMTVSGRVGALSKDANATAIRIGAGATVPELRNSGTIEATGGKAATSAVQALVIEAGAAMGAVRNSGAIIATVSGADGTATAILDRSGTLALIENSGGITATGPAGSTGKAIAIDLAANNGGATVRQTLVATGTAPSISGAIRFGAGDDLLDLADGTMTGAVSFGAGANRLALAGDTVMGGGVSFGNGADVVTLAGTSKLNGALDFGGGADSFTLGGTARFTGSLANSAGLALNIGSGAIDLANGGAVQLAALNVGAGGSLNVNIDAAAGTNTLYQVSGAAGFAAGSKLVVRLANVRESEGDYVVVSAASVTGAAGLAPDTAALPFLYAGTLATNTAATEVKLTIRRKTATELGLNASQAAAYSAIYAALDNDAKVAGSFLAINDGTAFRDSYSQMLPDHAGGAFETVTRGSRAVARMLSDPLAPRADMGGWGFWLQQVAWDTSKDRGDTAGYDVSGWGFSGGAELFTGFGDIGLGLAYLAGKDSDAGTDNAVDADQFEATLYWRGRWGGLSAHARASAAHVDFSESRSFSGMVGTERISRVATGDWSGRLLSAAAGLAWEGRFGRISLRPALAIDYYRLREKGHAETGGGDAFNLTIDGRTSDELAGSATVAAGLNFGDMAGDKGWFRAEIEGGRRQILGGSLGRTTANFKNGQDFTLTPEERSDGWTGGLRLIGGTGSFSLGGEFSAEEQHGKAALAFRATVRMGL